MTLTGLAADFTRGSRAVVVHRLSAIAAMLVGALTGALLVIRTKPSVRFDPRARRGGTCRGRPRPPIARGLVRSKLNPPGPLRTEGRSHRATHPVAAPRRWPGAGGGMEVPGALHQRSPPATASPGGGRRRLGGVICRRRRRPAFSPPWRQGSRLSSRPLGRRMRANRGGRLLK
jgi:hypothetical protein